MTKIGEMDFLSFLCRNLKKKMENKSVKCTLLEVFWKRHIPTNADYKRLLSLVRHLVRKKNWKYPIKSYAMLFLSSSAFSSPIFAQKMPIKAVNINATWRKTNSSAIPVLSTLNKHALLLIPLRFTML